MSFQDHHDDERDKTVVHNISPDLQDRFFWSQTGLVLRPTSHHWFAVGNFLVKYVFALLKCRPEAKQMGIVKFGGVGDSLAAQHNTGDLSKRPAVN